MRLARTPKLEEARQKSQKSLNDATPPLDDFKSESENYGGIAQPSLPPNISNKPPGKEPLDGKNSEQAHLLQENQGKPQGHHSQAE